jgi:hypothetical protein
VDETARRIGERVGAFIRDARSDEFERIALDVFAYQYEHVPPYRAFCDRRGQTPSDARSWREIPAVPAEAFAEVAFHSSPSDLVFETSGTTRGGGGRGEHHVADPGLYVLSLLTAFRRFVLPDRDRIRMLSLVPSVDEEPRSSLSYMACTLLAECGDSESRTYTHAHRVLFGAFFAALERSSALGEPVLLFGTTSAFVNVLRTATDAGLRCLLPQGSRLVDTGGHKGKDQPFDDGELVRLYGEVFGIPSWACANEYGMTELLSQMYNDDLRCVLAGERSPRPAAAGSERGVRREVKYAPHWIRPRILDPGTLAEAEEGILAYVDLANVHSVQAIATADLGRRTASGFVLLGRRSGAGARGCSIAMDEWLR